jgi:hypothetical protein
MFDKFGIIQPIKKINYNIEEELDKYYNSFVNGLEYNSMFLKSQLYSCDKSFSEWFKNKLSLKIDIICIDIFLNELPTSIQNGLRTILINYINSESYYEKIHLTLMTNDSLLIIWSKEYFDNLCLKYIDNDKFDEYYSEQIIKVFHNLNIKEFKELLKTQLLSSLEKYYKLFEFNNKQKDLILIVIKKIMNIIDINTINNNNKKIKYKYIFHQFIQKNINTLLFSNNNILYKLVKNNFKDTAKLISKQYIDFLDNINNNQIFESFNKLIYYCSNIQFTFDGGIDKQKNYYLKYISENLKKKNIHKFIINMLKYISSCNDDLIILFENKIKNALLHSKYDKYNSLITDYKIIISKIELNPNTYDFVKYFNTFVNTYEIKNKNKDFRKLLLLSSDTFINKYDDDDIYLSDNSELNKVINQITKDSVYISKENSMFIVEIIKDGKPENIKLNMNQYMILHSLENNIENNFDVLKKGYGSKNMDYLVKNSYIKIEDNLAKKLIN